MQPIFQFLSPHDIADFTALLTVFAVAFDMPSFTPPDRRHLQQVLAKPDLLVLVAKVDGVVVGGLTTYRIDSYYREKPQAYLYDLAVQTAFQRQGIGSALIRQLTAYCREQGFDEVFVQADQADLHALDFYQSTGATTATAVVHFGYRL